MKVVLITGSNSGMGLATTKLLSRNGYKVYAGVRTGENVDFMSNIAATDNLAIEPVLLDVTETHSIENAVTKITSNEGKIDILINNAGYGLVSSVEDGTDKEFISQFDVNVFGVLRCCRSVIPYMREKRSGTIINISSFLGQMGLPLLTHYNSSKYAVEGITDSLRYELEPFNINVHTVAPGLFQTGFVNKGLTCNPNTVSSKSPYVDQANTLLPLVSDKINNGPTPATVAETVLEILKMGSPPARIPAGEDSIFFDQLRKEKSHEEFEVIIKKQLGL